VDILNNDIQTLLDRRTQAICRPKRAHFITPFRELRYRSRQVFRTGIDHLRRLCRSTIQAPEDEHTFIPIMIKRVYPAGYNIVTTGVPTMFSHESTPLILMFVILLLCMLAAVLHPVHAFFDRVRRRRGSSAEIAKEVDSR
jgi:hypothetical protein